MIKRKLIISLAIFVCVLFCAGFTLYATPVNAQGTDYFRMRSGASIRLNDNNSCGGIRFIAEIGEDYLDGKVDTENNTYVTDGTYFGMIIVPEEYLYNEDFGFYNQQTYTDMHDYFENGLGKLIDLKYDGADDIYVKGGKYYLRGSIKDIYIQNYNLDFVGIGYWFDGSNYTYATPSDTTYEGRNITYVASAALSDFSEEETEDYLYETSDNLGGTVYSPFDDIQRQSLESEIVNGLLSAQGVKFSNGEYVYNSSTYETLDEVLSANSNLTTELTLDTAVSQNGYVGSTAPLTHNELVEVEKKLVSADESIVRITEDGKLEYLRSGATSVTLYALGNRIAETCNILVSEKHLMIEDYYPDFYNEENVDIVNGDYEVVENTNYNVVGSKLIKLSGNNHRVTFKTPILLGRTNTTNVAFGFWTYADAEIGSLTAAAGGDVNKGAVKTWTITNWNVYYLCAWNKAEIDEYGNIYLKSFDVTMSIPTGKTANVYVGGFFLSNSVADDCVITLEDYDANPTTDGETEYTLPNCTTGETMVSVYDVTAGSSVIVTDGKFLPTPDHEYTVTYTLETAYKTITKDITITFANSLQPAFLTIPTTASVANGTSISSWVSENAPSITNDATLSYKISIYHYGGATTTNNAGGGKNVYSSDNIGTRKFSSDWTYVFEWTAQNEYGSVSCRQNVYVVQDGAQSFSCEGATIVSGSAEIVNLGTESAPHYAIKVTGTAVIEFAQNIVSDGKNNFAIGVTNKGTGTLKLHTYNSASTTVYSYILFSEAVAIRVGANRGDTNYITDGKLKVKFQFAEVSGDNEIYIEFFQIGANEIAE